MAAHLEHPCQSFGLGVVGHRRSHRFGGVHHRSSPHRHHRIAAGTGLFGAGHNGKGGIGLYAVKDGILHFGPPDTVQQAIQQAGLVQKSVRNDQGLSGAQHFQQPPRLFGLSRPDISHWRGLGHKFDDRLAHGNTQLGHRGIHHIPSSSPIHAGFFHPYFTTRTYWKQDFRI